MQASLIRKWGRIVLTAGRFPESATPTRHIPTSSILTAATSGHAFVTCSAKKEFMSVRPLVNTSKRQVQARHTQKGDCSDEWPCHRPLQCMRLNFDKNAMAKEGCSVSTTYIDIYGCGPCLCSHFGWQGGEFTPTMLVSVN